MIVARDFILRQGGSLPLPACRRKDRDYRLIIAGAARKSCTSRTTVQSGAPIPLYYPFMQHIYMHHVNTSETERWAAGGRPPIYPSTGAEKASSQLAIRAVRA